LPEKIISQTQEKKAFRQLPPKQPLEEIFNDYILYFFEFSKDNIYIFRKTHLLLKKK